MILRRVIEHVRTQNWTAVLLDFVIVVIGIFVGLQVSEWNERRQLREREHEYLVRLQEDVNQMQGALAFIMERGDGRREATLRTFRALEACDESIATPDDFQRTFAEYQNQQSAVVIGRTYEEMVSSGALAAMDDRTLSGDIAGVFGALESYVRFIDAIRVSLPVIDRVLWNNVDLSYDAKGRPRLASFDFSAACGNRELRNAVWEIHDLVWDWEMVTVRTSGQIDSLAARLERHLAEKTGSEPVLPENGL